MEEERPMSTRSGRRMTEAESRRRKGYPSLVIYSDLVKDTGTSSSDFDILREECPVVSVESYHVNQTR